MFSLLYKDIVLYLKQCGLIFAGILLFSSSLLIVPAEEEMTDSKGLIMLLLCWNREFMKKMKTRNGRCFYLPHHCYIRGRFSQNILRH